MFMTDLLQSFEMPDRTGLLRRAGEREKERERERERAGTD
eukprot:COSAG03_NODE_22740_length_287_cov_1.095745_1_plen_39_part_01